MVYSFKFVPYKTVKELLEEKPSITWTGSSENYYRTVQCIVNTRTQCFKLMERFKCFFYEKQARTNFPDCDNVYGVESGPEQITLETMTFKIETEFRDFNLRFYEREGNIYRDTENIRVSQSEAVKIAKKYSRHFNFVLAKKPIKFVNRKNGTAFCNYDFIKLPKNPDFYLLIHELAHLADSQLNHRDSKHDKKLMHMIKRFHGFAKKNRYWKTTELAIRRPIETQLMKVETW